MINQVFVSTDFQTTASLARPTRFHSHKIAFWVFILLMAGFCTQVLCQNTDTLVISIRHGHRIKKDYRKTGRILPGGGFRKSVGGLKGGHVEVWMDTLVYGFTDTPQAKIPHIFSHKPKKSNGLFVKMSHSEWQKSHQNSKITFVKIPVSEEQWRALQQNYESNLVDCPYDFALFGMRCASSGYDMLAQVGILDSRSRFRTVMGIFHPRAFRKYILSWARKRNYPIEIQEGSNLFIWDH